MFNNKKILCISAHMDDIELGCGGLIKTLEGKSEIWVLALSKDRKDSNGNVQEIRDLQEQYLALKHLGISTERFISSEGITGQLFPEYRQKILEEMYRVKALINPDIIITTSMNDVHQDHRIVCQCAQKAFSRSTRLSYEIINATNGFNPNLYFEISKKALIAKSAAVNAYKSQQDSNTTSADYFSEEIITSLAIARGARQGMKYAECFEVHQVVISKHSLILSS